MASVDAPLPSGPPRSSAQALYRLIVAVRIASNRLKGASDALHRDLDVNVSLRGVLESLADAAVQGASKTVPAIARDKGVSRQHIQLVVDSGLRRGLVEVVDNPAHKRSPVIVLSPKGAKIFDEIRRREKTILESLAQGLDPDAMDAAAALLATLNGRLAALEGDDDGEQAA